MKVTRLARWVVNGNSQPHVVKLVRDNGNGQYSDVGSATVITSGATPNQFAWAWLPSTLTLSAGTYYLLSQEVSGGDYWYNYECRLYTDGMGQIDFSGIRDSSVKLIDAISGSPVAGFNPKVTLSHDYGAVASSQYQGLLQIDLDGFSTAGEYRLQVDGFGASFPFRIGDEVPMKFARTYALGLYHQRCGSGAGGKTVNDLPFRRFTHENCHTAPASVPLPAASFFDAWNFIAGYGNDANAYQTANKLTSSDAQNMLFQFQRTGTVDVSGGHHDAADYSKYTHNSAQLIHTLIFAADHFPGVVRVYRKAATEFPTYCRKRSGKLTLS